MKRKILFITDCPYYESGYATVMRNLLPSLREAYDISIMGLQHHTGQPIEWQGVKIYPCGGSPYGLRKVPEIVKSLKPGIVVTLCDIGYQYSYSHFFEKYNKCRWIAYTPIDTPHCPTWFRDILPKLDVFVTCSEFAQKLMKEQFDYESQMIPHGVDTQVFKPLNREKRRELRKKDALLGKFIVGFVGVNQNRKRIDYMIRAFSKFAEGKKDAILMMHTDPLPYRSSPQAMAEGWNILALAQKYEVLEKNLVFTYSHLTGKPNPDWRNNFSPAQLNEVYNMMDVHLNAGNEGFGLPIIESQAAGVVACNGNATSVRELTEEAGVLVRIKDYVDGENACEYVLPDVNHWSKQLEKLYLEAKWRRDLSRQAREFALKYDWSRIVPRWVKLIDEI